MADAFETILVAWLAFAFLPERPTRSRGGTDGSNPLCSSGESGANRDRGDQRSPLIDIAAPEKPHISEHFVPGVT